MSMTKEELLKVIDDAIDLEERSIRIYRKHLDTALFWSGLPELKRDQINMHFNFLATESSKHWAKLAALRKKIEKGGKDVY